MCVSYCCASDVHILRDAVGISWYHLRRLHWHNFFTIERCRASALLNAHVSLSFFVDGELDMSQISSYTGQNPRTTKKESKTNQLDF